MALLESAIIKKIRRKLKEDYGRDLYIFKTHGGADQIRGLPDLIGCYHGYYVAMEVKVPGKDATPLQALTIKQIKAAGGFATVVHSYEEVVDFLAIVPAPPAEATEERD